MDDTKSVELRVGQARHPAVSPERTAEQADEIRQLSRSCLYDWAARQYDLEAGTLHRRAAVLRCEQPVEEDSLFQGNDGGTAANTDGGV